MAKNAANHLDYYLCIEEAHKDDLGNIRQWHQLNIAFDKGKIWVKGFNYSQINALAVKSIPYKEVFFAKEGKLFLLNSLLPDRNIPSLLWTPIERALPIQLPSFNHNYFGIQEKIAINLIPSEEETNAIAMITTMNNLNQYIETAPDIRLQYLEWTVLDKEKAFLLGKPLLPIKGQAYWKDGSFIIPSGYNFDLFSLKNALNKQINPENKSLIIWNKDNTYFPIDKNDMQPLTLSSFRKTKLFFSY